MLHFEFPDPAAEPCAQPLAVTIGERIASRLADGCHLTRGAISALLADETGVGSWGTAWSIDDFNDAIEIGALLWLRSHGRIALETSIHEAEARFEWLDAALPSRHVRSEAQVELQQFSTPPMLSWLMARAAQLRTSDTVLEPSAGNGTLALWPAMHRCCLNLNEIDPDRRQSLAHLFPGAAVTAHDGELIDHLVGHRTPTVVLMNPPFARSRERGISASTALRHLRSAMRLSRSGARLFSGEFIGEAEVKEQALAWVPAVMRFGTPKEEVAGDDETPARSEDADDELTEQAA